MLRIDTKNTLHKVSFLLKCTNLRETVGTCARLQVAATIIITLLLLMYNELIFHERNMNNDAS